MDSWLDVLEEQQVALDQRGWAIHVVPDPPTSWPPYAYTTGLTLHERAELFIVGLGIATMHKILNHLCREVFDRNADFTHGQVLPHLFAANFHAVILEGTPSPDMPMQMTDVRFGPGSYRVQQITWPDGAGRFPWEQGYGLTARHQPLIAME